MAIALKAVPLPGYHEGGCTPERLGEMRRFCDNLWCSTCIGIGMDFESYESDDGRKVRYFRTCRECGAVEEF